VPAAARAARGRAPRIRTCLSLRDKRPQRQRRAPSPPPPAPPQLRPPDAHRAGAARPKQHLRAPAGRRLTALTKQRAPKGRNPPGPRLRAAHCPQSLELSGAAAAGAPPKSPSSPPVDFLLKQHTPCHPIFYWPPAAPPPRPAPQRRRQPPRAAGAGDAPGRRARAPARAAPGPGAAPPGADCRVLCCVLPACLKCLASAPNKRPREPRAPPPRAAGPTPCMCTRLDLPVACQRHRRCRCGPTAAAGAAPPNGLRSVSAARRARGPHAARPPLRQRRRAACPLLGERRRKPARAGQTRAPRWPVAPRRRARRGAPPPPYPSSSRGRLCRPPLCSIGRGPTRACSMHAAAARRGAYPGFSRPARRRAARPANRRAAAAAGGGGARARAAPAGRGPRRAARLPQAAIP
jgi:hypothetical protein